MDYFYDILINMNEDDIYNFYEWENYDIIEYIKKIPLFRVSTKTLIDFYSNYVQINEEFLINLLDKTVTKNSKLNKTIKYGCLLCDTKNVLVVEFNDCGEVISRSSLLLEDEANILEVIYNYKETNIRYVNLGNRNISQKLRQEKLIKKVIKLEFNTLIDDNNQAKLKYLYNEWFGYNEENLVKIRKNIKEELDADLTQKTKKIYDLIMLSYNKS